MFAVQPDNFAGHQGRSAGQIVEHSACAQGHLSEEQVSSIGKLEYFAEGMESTLEVQVSSCGELRYLSGSLGNL